MFYDPDTQARDTQYVGVGEVSVTQFELGLPTGHVIYEHCVGSDFYRLRADTTFPFDYLDIEVNSPTCGFGPPVVCDLAATVSTTDETVTGSGDGTAAVNATASAGLFPLEYSLDGSLWQSSAVFTGLMPGSYTAYVRSAGMISCAVIVNFSIAAAASAVFTTIPWTEKFCHFFRLETQATGGPVDVAEPAKWDSVFFKGIRDKDWHGYNSQYSDGNLQLEFDCPAGRDIIETEYDARGSDGVVYFYYGYTSGAQDHILFNGKLNLNTRKKYGGKTTCTVERKDFNQLLQSRFETKVSMIDTKSVDGLTIPAPPIVPFTMHSKQVERHYRNQYPDRFEYPQITQIVAGSNVYLQPETSSPQLSEIEDYFGYPIGVSNSSLVTDDKFTWRIKFNGSYTINIDFNFELKLRSRLLPNSFTLTHFMQIAGSVNVTNQLAAPISDVLPGSVQKIYNTHAAASGTFTLEPGDKIYIYSVLHFNSASSMDIWLAQTAINTTASSLESAPASDAKGWFIFEAIDHTLKNITNGGAKLVSGFLSRQGPQQPADGPGSLFIVTNGKQIRQYDPTGHPLRISAKELLTSAKFLWGLGMSFERGGTFDLVRVERINYYYRNREILVIEECEGYYEETAKDLLANEIETGYEKYLEQGYDTLDEFNTVRIWTGPIQTNKLKATLKSTLIASGYAIEDVRRQQFQDTATDSYQYDEDGFIISMVRDATNFIPERNENFLTVNNLLSPETAYNLRISPLRMLLNSAIWLKNLFFYKQPADFLKNTWTVQNGELETQLLATDPDQVGDINRSLWKDRQDVDLVNFAVEENLFKPDWIYFKCRLTPDLIQLIDDSLRGARTSATNYGFLTVKDPHGLYQAGWPYEITYNFATEKAEFKLLKKWDSPVTPGEACCEYLVVNGCYVLVNGNKVIL